MIRENNILAKEITPHSKLEALGYRSEAAVLVVVNKFGHVLLVQENEDDPEFGRRSGQWNLITETWKDGQSMKGNFISAIEEELGPVNRLKSLIKLIRGSYREADFGPEACNPSRAHLAVFRFMGDEKEPPFNPVNSEEIKGYQWATIDDINRLHKQDLLAPSVHKYIEQLHNDNLLQPYTNQELHDELRERAHGNAGEDVLRK